MKTVYVSYCSEGNVQVEGVLPAEIDGSVAAIGNFDGVHLGHRAVLHEGTRLAAEFGCALGIITFEPHPRAFFSREKDYRSLTPVQEKSRVMAHHGARYHVVLRFDAAFGNMAADDFVTTILQQTLNIRAVVTGLDFRFGRKRGGDIITLEHWAKRTNRSTSSIAPFVLAGEAAPVSSTRIRQALAQGDTASARNLLGRAYCIAGEVIRGDQRARTIGFPTANLAVDGWVVPLLGVYAVKVALPHEQSMYSAVANVGMRPTFAGKKLLLEVHLFDFAASKEIYGQTLRVYFGDFLRPEKKFDGVDQLKQQIAIDCEAARRAWLKLEDISSSVV